jgi:two-component system, sensor histidine kinase LadS
MMKKRFILTLISISLAVSINAQTIILSDSILKYDIGLNLEILEDSSQRLNLSDVISGKYQFPKATKQIPNLGISPSAFWVRFSFVNQAKSHQWFLEDYFRHIGKIDYYLLDSENKVMDIILAGDWRGKRNRPIGTNNYVFPIKANNKVQNIYLRIESINTKIFPFRIWEERFFWDDAQQSSLIHGIYFGIILILIFYFSILYIYSLTKGYLYFTLYLLSLFISELIRENGNFYVRYLGAVFPFLTLYVIEIYYTILVLTIVFNILFYSDSLKIRSDYTKLHRLLKLSWIPFIVFLPVIWLRLVPTSVSLFMTYFTPLCGYSIAGIISLIRWKQGFSSAKYYVVGSVFFVVGILATSLSYANVVLTNHVLFQQILNICVILEILFLSLGFADSIRIERKKAIQNLLEINEELVKKNAEIKTSVMEGQILERKRVERELHDSLGSVLFGVRASLFGIQHENLSKNQQESYKNVEKLLMRAEQEVKVISHNQFPPELVTDSLMIALRNYVDDLNSLKVTNFKLIAESFVEELNPKTKFELFSIVRELTANILKHARASEATIYFENLANFIQITVQDNGKGFDTNKVSKGLGMKNLSFRVEQELFGKLEIHSNNEGTRILIIVPN